MSAATHFGTVTHLVLIAVYTLLSACVATPQGPRVSAYPALGLPLSATESIALFVSTEVSRGHSPETEGTQTHQISKIGAVVQGFTAGFRAVGSDALFMVADEELQTACFESGTKSVESGGAVLVVPNLAAGQCRELLDRRALRYLVSIAGSRNTLSRFIYDIFSIQYEHDHTFILLASVFDTMNESSVCEASKIDVARSFEGAAMYYFIIPSPGFRALDETGYWESLGWQVGAHIGSCFLQPGERK